MSKKFKILVIGEQILDSFIIGDATRKAPEGAFLIFQPRLTTYNNGGAGNVYENLKTLSPNSEILFLHQKTEIKKTRLVDNGSSTPLIRIDENDFVNESEKFKLSDLEQFWSDIDSIDLDALIISDYGKGYISTKDIEALADICSAKNIPTFLDCKHLLGQWSGNITFCKINLLEFNNNLKVDKHPENFVQNLIVSLGRDGIMWVKKNGEKLVVPTEKVEVAFQSGCGDSVMASIAISYIEGNPIEKMLEHGNKAGAYAAARRAVIAVPREAVF